MSKYYEGMFLIDNETVRGGWAQAKAGVVDLIKKHGGTVRCARRWGERRLAYSIRQKHRATFLLAYYEIPGPSIPGLQLELNISEHVLRYLIVGLDLVPEKELELA